MPFEPKVRVVSAEEWVKLRKCEPEIMTAINFNWPPALYVEGDVAPNTITADLIAVIREGETFMVSARETIQPDADEPIIVEKQ